VPIQFERRDEGDETVLSIGGSLDALTAQELAPTIDQLVAEKRPKVRVDLAGLDLIDSSGIGAIVALYKRIRANGGQVSVVGMRDQPLAIFKLLRMDRVLAK
jgi:anti-sigma B factor antagonist